jgi:hypothetical protein
MLEGGNLLSLNVVRDVMVRNTGKKKHVERIQGNGLPELALYYKPLERDIRVVPERDGKSNSWMRVI